MDVRTVKDFIVKWSDENLKEFYEAAEKIWKHSELSMQEYESSKVLKDLLRKNGFHIDECAGGMPTAFVASYGNGGPVIGINAEFDALPGLSQKKNCDYKEPINPGAPGHGCGHNLLGAAMVKAAIALKKAIVEFKLSGSIKVFGAAAEELCLGKPFLGKAGLLEGIDAFLDWHPWSYNRADYDSCCSYFSVKYHYSGRTCHGNSPWHGRSALDAAMLQAHAVEMMREHIYPGAPPDAANTINYTFTNTGPEFPSVVPDKTTAWYIGRFITTKDAQDALRRITNCAKGAAMSTETEVEVEIITATNHKIPNQTLAEALHKNFLEIGPPLFTAEEQETAKEIQRHLDVAQTGLATEIMPFSGGYTVVCDTSEYSWNAPYASAWVAMAPENCGWHHWGIVSCSGGSMGQKSMDVAAKIIGNTAIDLICNPQLIEKAQVEFKERLAGEKYQCLLPKDHLPPIELNKEIMEKYKK